MSAELPGPTPHPTPRPVRHPVRRLVGLVAGVVTLVMAATLGLAAVPAWAQVNLLSNPDLEILDGGFPACWNAAGWGDADYTFALTDQAHSGEVAMSLTIDAITSGDRKLMMAETPLCAPQVTPEHQYDLSVWYTTTSPATVMTLFRRDVTSGWQYWTDLATLPVTTEYTRAEVRTPPVPAGTDQITWGVTLYGVGTLVTDDYSMVDVTVPAPEPECEPGAPCQVGAWTVSPHETPVNGIHAVVLHDTTGTGTGGDVLLIAGSGNDPDAFAAGTFTTTRYRPATGEFVEVPTPADLFCAGHVQLADGRVLVMGGNRDYPEFSGHGNYEGLPDSYVFDPSTNSYQRINDMPSGHWYPSATILGNGDVLSLGGIGADGNGTVATEYYDAAQGRWLELWEANQTWRFWGLYPAMILMQDGRLFYTGSHVFGDGLPGTGASIYDYQDGSVVDVPGLRNKDQRDQSMSVLLPPAQDQRVLTLGGGNIETNPDANRLTDIIDLKAAQPEYVPGPPIPLGTLDGGVPQTGDQGKMYVSAVILPDGMVFETGGALHNRATPVYEASMFDPATDSFIPGMATDPVPRGYHSSAFLLPDGRVMAVGDNPGDGSFDRRISIYSPPYLFRGDRPEIQAVASSEWSYGSSQQVTVAGAVTRAALIRPAAVTHSSDPNQRLVELPMTVTGGGSTGGTIDLHVTSNPNLAPPGWYMLFVVGPDGVPSVAQWVRVG